MKSTKPESRTKPQNAKVPTLNHRNEIALAVSHQSINNLNNKLDTYEANETKKAPICSTPYKFSAPTAASAKAIPTTAKSTAKNPIKSDSSTNDKLNNQNKENNDLSGLPIKTLGRVYKSRDGLTAFSSNTSIMSEVSNISKSSLPVASRSNTMASSSNIGNQSLKVPNSAAPKSTKNTPLVNSTNSVIMSRKKLELASSSNTSSTHNMNALAQKKALATPQIGVAKKNLILNVNSSASVKNAEPKTAKKPGIVVSGEVPSSDAKWVCEIKRLEALCESRTKELNMLKLQLKQTLVAFDSIAVAFKYLSDNVSFLKSEILGFY